MPFAGYSDFADCVSRNRDKNDPDAYCGSIKHKVEDKAMHKSIIKLCDDIAAMFGVSDEDKAAPSNPQKFGQRALARPQVGQAGGPRGEKRAPDPVAEALERIRTGTATGGVPQTGRPGRPEPWESKSASPKPAMPKLNRPKPGEGRDPSDHPSAGKLGWNPPGPKKPRGAGDDPSMDPRNFQLARENKPASPKPAMPKAQATTPAGHAKKIARDTARMPKPMQGVMGGPADRKVDNIGPFGRNDSGPGSGAKKPARPQSAAPKPQPRMQPDGFAPRESVGGGGRGPASFNHNPWSFQRAMKALDDVADRYC